MAATRGALGAAAAVVMTACFVDVPLDPSTTAATTTTSDTADPSTAADPCPAGDDGCPCLPGGACGPDLACEADRCLPAPVCGDWVKAPSEECDDGNQDDGDGCTAACRLARCGDGHLWVGVEACDDGDDVDGDGCNTDCIPSGALRWQQTATGPGAEQDIAFAVVVGSVGEVYVAGGVRPAPGAGRDVWFARYDASGALEWQRTFDGPAGLEDFGRALALAPGGDLIVGGVVRTLTNNTPDDEVFLGRYAGADGREIWSTLLTGPVPTASDSVRGLRVDPDQTILAAGQQGQAMTGNDLWLARFTADGAPLWSRAFDGGGGAGAQSDRGFGLDRRADGALVVCGERDGVDGKDAWIIVTDPDGQPLWDRTFDGGAKNPEVATACAANPAGTIYVLVNEVVPGEGDYWLLGYSGAGDLGWKFRYGDLGALESAHGVVVDPAGDVIFVGGEPEVGKGRDLSVRRLGADAQLCWRRALGGPSDDLAYAVALAPGGDVVVVGEAALGASGLDVWIGKLAP